MLPDKSSPTFWQALRHQEFPRLSSIYLNAAYFGPLPEVSKNALDLAAVRSMDPSFMDYGWVELPEIARAKIGNLIGCHANNVSLNTSTSEIISTAAFGSNLMAGDRVALMEGEYPSNVLSWMHLAERIKIHVDFYPREQLRDPESWVNSLPVNTKVCALSYVCFQTGNILDIEAIGKALSKREILFIVDVTQALGGMPIPKSALPWIDIMPCSAYKWMLAPYGNAFSYWSDSAIAATNAMHAGWLSMPQAPKNLTAYTTQYRQGARKFDRGQTPNVILLSALMASVDLIMAIGLEEIYQYNQSLLNIFRENLDPDQYDVVTSNFGSNIICLRAKTHIKGSDPRDLQNKFRQQNIDVSVREGNVRIAFHFFNQPEEIKLLLKS